jgi:CRISPR-associated protein Cmr4
VADVDLPVQREATTEFLKIAASALRRAFRDPLQDSRYENHERILFGSTLKRSEGDSFGPGILDVRDARILLLPVRSFPETFVWTTSPLCVARLRRVGVDLPPFSALDRGKALVGTNSNFTGSLLLEEYELTPDASQSNNVNRLASWLRENALPEPYAFWRDWLIQDQQGNRLVVVADDFFKELCRTACEVSTHVRISPETGTVETGALWTVEDVPQESVFFTVVACDTPPENCPNDFKKDGRPSAAEAFQFFKRLLPDGALLRLGGDEGIGRGYLRVRWYDHGAC